MVYEYDEFIDTIRFGLTMSDRDTTDDIWKMVDEVVNKAKAWEELKEEMRSMFVWGSDLPKGTPSKYMNEAYGIVFKKMCELDNTNDFNNLLSDMEDE